MKKRSLVALLSIGVILLAVSAYIYVRREYLSPAQITNTIKIEPLWVAYDADHVVVEFDVTGSIQTSDGDFTDCPVGKGIVSDGSGNDITGEVDTFCRFVSVGKYSVTQSYYNDFKNKIPRTLKIQIGDQIFYSAKNNKEMSVPVVKTISLDLPTQSEADITTYPTDVAQASSGIDLTVKKAEFTPRAIKVNACMTLPDAGDWGLDAQIIVDGQSFPVDYWSIPNYRDPKTFASNKRCFELFFSKAPDFQTVDPGKISFLVRRVYLNTPDCVDTKNFGKIKDELAKYGIDPVPDAAGNYCFTSDIQNKASPEENALLNTYIQEALKNEVVGPLEITIK
jgi:hypothetical protein